MRVFCCFLMTVYISIELYFFFLFIIDVIFWVTVIAAKVYNALVLNRI